VSGEIESRPVRDDGLAGVLCRPRAGGPAPGVLLLGGSEGGLHERDAQVLAGHGFTVLALAYFGMPGLPPGLVDIPLEYFVRGLDLLAAEPGTGARFGILGGSRGGEAALLTAAHDERVGAVVSVVGSGLVTQGIDYRRGALLEILGHPTVSWTWRGEPLPYLPNVIPDELRDLIAHSRPVPLRLAFPPVPEDPAVLERVSIPVERIRGAVLLISAGEDGMWPGVAYGQVAADRLARSRHPFTFGHRVFGEAGHAIAGPPPPGPAAGDGGTTSPGPGVTFEMGGTVAATRAARAGAWQATVGFLGEHLRN
jgi:dienelactone hydrolase